MDVGLTPVFTDSLALVFDGRGGGGGGGGGGAGDSRAGGSGGGESRHPRLTSAVMTKSRRLTSVVMER